MNKLLCKRVTIRFTEDEFDAYRVAAANVGLTPSEYLRLRLASVDDDQVAAELAQLRLTIFDNLMPAEAELGDAPVWFLEVLLLLRSICQPATVRSVQSELRRLGYTPWSGEDRASRVT